MNKLTNSLLVVWELGVQRSSVGESTEKGIECMITMFRSAGVVIKVLHNGNSIIHGKHSNKERIDGR